MTSPHLNAPAGSFAPTVLLPGDPRRATHVATTLLEDARLVTDVRNMLGYTGTWRGEPVSVLGGGIGIPSTLIYATELVRDHGVRRIVRIGTCGGLQPGLGLGDLVLALGAGTDSRVNRIRFRDYDYPATASWSLLEPAARRAAAARQPLHVGNVFSSDLFYHPDAGLHGRLRALGFLAIEMEAAGLYGLAAELGFEALAVLTVTDHVGRPESMTAAERETGVDAMTRLVLEALVPG
jgi:purine-nucleoside phosphorylase